MLSNEVPNAVGALISALKDPNSRDRFYAVRSLGTSADPRSLAPLLALFRTPTWNFVTSWPILQYSAQNSPFCSITARSPAITVAVVSSGASCA